MMRKRFHLMVDANGSLRVDMPTYAMVPGTFLPIVAGVTHADGVAPGQAETAVATHAVSVLVEIPGDTPLMPQGMVDAATMRRRYREHHRFGSDTWTPPRVLGDK